MRTLMVFQIYVMAFLLISSCAERTAEQAGTSSEALIQIVGSWEQISGVAIDSGCGIVRTYTKDGVFYMQTWLKKDTTKSSIDAMSGTYTIREAFETTTNTQGQVEIKRKLYRVVLGYQGWDKKQGCDGKGGERIGQTGEGYYEFNRQLNSDGTVTDQIKVYDLNKTTNVVETKASSVYNKVTTTTQTTGT